MLRELLTKTELQCDFCGGPSPTWIYPGKNTTQVPLVLDGDLVPVGGDWMACTTCHMFIEAGDFDKLDELAIKEFRENPAWKALKERTSDDDLKDYASMIHEQIRMAHRAFLENRLGKARPI